MLFNPANDTGTIDDDINPVEIINERTDGLLVADVKLARADIEILRRAELVSAKADCHHLCTEPRKRKRNLRSDARGGAGHKSDLAGEKVGLECHVLALSI